MPATLPQEYKDLPWSVRKKQGSLKPGEKAPMYPSTGETVPAVSSAPKTETKPMPVEKSETHVESVASTGGIAADPKLLKEISEKLKSLESSVNEKFYEEAFSEEGISEYAGSGIREKNAPVSVALVVVYIIIAAWVMGMIL
ncbi:MAG: hypothetical protein A3G23_06305 [Bacteroidetes bacterium RIFCSPLOWO2_12_FULL_37_12]|nr:MAG: hypothetical protein A3G23_06305 [Bacteroidetes bacterium RIFCSPLOWO2_12_FULL_37_12]